MKHLLRLFTPDKWLRLILVWIFKDVAAARIAFDYVAENNADSSPRWKLYTKLNESLCYKNMGLLKDSTFNEALRSCLKQL